jgi:hypothetical protein
LEHLPLAVAESQGYAVLDGVVDRVPVQAAAL